MVKLTKLERGLLDGFDAAWKDSPSSGSVLNVGLRNKEPYIRGTTGLPVRTIRFENLPEDRAFDVVVAVGGIEASGDPAHYVSRLINLVADCGTLYIGAPLSSPPMGDNDYWRVTPDALRMIIGDRLDEVSCGVIDRWNVKGSFFYGMKKATGDDSEQG